MQQSSTKFDSKGTIKGCVHLSEFNSIDYSSSDSSPWSECLRFLIEEIAFEQTPKFANPKVFPDLSDRPENSKFTSSNFKSETDVP